MAKKVLILSVRAGIGHIKAASAIEQAITTHYPDCTVQHSNALDYTNRFYARSISRGYEDISRKLPSLWGMIYDSFEEEKFAKRAKDFSRLMARIHAQSLLKYIALFKPDRIVCTHFMPAEILAHARMKKRLAIPVDVVVTDYDIHTIWVQPGISRYFVGSDETAHVLRTRFSGDHDIVVSGIPVQKEFCSPRDTKKSLRKKMGIKDSDSVVLVLSGGAGLIQVDAIVDELAKANDTVKIFASGGKNAALGKSLSRIARNHPGRVTVFGFIDNLHELMRASDLIITKSGGLTISECLAAGLPMIIARPIPGQEERNAVYIVENGAGLWAHTPENIVYKTLRLLEDKRALRACAEASKRLGKPNAAESIARMVVA